MASSSAATSAGLPSHHVVTSSGRVRATREPDMYEPAASDSPSGPPARPVRASASASTCGRPMTRATAVSCSAAVVGTGRAPRSQTSSAMPQPGLQVGVVLERSAPTGRRGTAAGRPPPSRVSSVPASGWPPTKRDVGDEFAHRGQHRLLSVPTSVRTAPRPRCGASDARAAAHARAAASPARPGRRRAPRRRRWRRPGSRRRCRGRGRADRRRSRRPRGRPGAARCSSEPPIRPRPSTATRWNRCRPRRVDGRPYLDDRRRHSSRSGAGDFRASDRYVSGSDRPPGPVARSERWWADGAARFAIAAFRDGAAVAGRAAATGRARRPRRAAAGAAVAAARGRPVRDRRWSTTSSSSSPARTAARISLLLSDLTASVEYPLAEQAMTRLGEDPPEDDELDEVWPVGDLDLFADLDLSARTRWSRSSTTSTPTRTRCWTRSSSGGDRRGVSTRRATGRRRGRRLMSYFAAVLAGADDRWTGDARSSLADCEIARRHRRPAARRPTATCACC